MTQAAELHLMICLHSCAVHLLLSVLPSCLYVLLLNAVSTVCSVFCLPAMIRPENPVMKKTLGDFGEYIGQCMPKYVQHVQITHGNELEILIHPDGLLPVLSFLKNHTNAQFTQISDICGMDVPSRQYRFEVQTFFALFTFLACDSI